jgi:hypothetical protein
MPDSEQGAYIITRKSEELTQAEKYSAIQLHSLQLQDTLELVLNRSGVDRNDDNYEQGLKLVRALEKIPVVIVRVGTYIKKNIKSASTSIIECSRSRIADLLQRC